MGVKSMIDAVLFDLYGTLIDIHTDESTELFWQKFAKKCKRYHSLDAKQLQTIYLEKCHDFSKFKEEIDICDVFQSIFQLEKVKIKRIANIFRKLSTSYIRCYSGVHHLLKRLKKDGHPLYILSNAQSAFTIRELKKLKLIHFFDGIAISSDYGVKKPNLAFFKRALLNFKIDPNYCWMVGNDYECDILPAQACGLKTIYIESNLTPRKRDVEKLLAFDDEKIYCMLESKNK